MNLFISVFYLYTLPFPPPPSQNQGKAWAVVDLERKDAISFLQLPGLRVLPPAAWDGEKEIRHTPPPHPREG